MEKVKRFGVSIENSLLEKFDTHIESKNYKNRSEAIRDLIREKLVEEEWSKKDEEVAGAIILVYDHHKRELVDKLIDVQHDYSDLIISSQHIHLDHDNCLEIIVVKGRIRKIQQLESKLKSTKGVKHSLLTKSTLGKNL